MPQARSPTGIGQGQQDHEGSGERLTASPLRTQLLGATQAHPIDHFGSGDGEAVPFANRTWTGPHNATPAERHARASAAPYPPPSLVTSENGLGAEPPPTVTDRKQETPHTDAHRAGGRPRSEIKHERKHEGAE